MDSLRSQAGKVVFQILGIGYHEMNVGFGLSLKFYIKNFLAWGRPLRFRNRYEKRKSIGRQNGRR
jgi:hypothetical protein